MSGSQPGPPSRPTASSVNARVDTLYATVTSLKSAMEEEVRQLKASHVELVNQSTSAARDASERIFALGGNLDELQGIVSGNQKVLEQRIEQLTARANQKDLERRLEQLDERLDKELGETRRLSDFGLKNASDKMAKDLEAATTKLEQELERAQAAVNGFHSDLGSRLETAIAGVDARWTPPSSRRRRRSAKWTNPSRPSRRTSG